MNYNFMFYIFCSFFIFSILVFSFDHEKYDSRGFLANQSKSIMLNDQSLISEMVYTGIEFPTSMAFLKENDILVLEKNTGTVKRIIDKQIVEKPLIDLNVSTDGERGLLGIAVDNYTQNLDEAKYVFLYLTESRESDGEDSENNVIPIGNRVYRYEFLNEESELLNPKLLIDLPAGPKSMHNGGKIVIGPDKNLYFIVGDMGIDRSFAINDKKGTAMDGRAGILRITQNGDSVKDDFQLGKKHPLDKYYAYGIRNGFGLDFDPVTGNLWDSEIGPEFGDEINLVKPGFNGGWNKVQGIWETTGYTAGQVVLNPHNLVVFNDIGQYSPPKLTLYERTGFTAIKFFNSNKLGDKYTNTLFVGDFHKGKLYNFKLDDERNYLLLGSDNNYENVFFNETDLDPFIFGEGFGGIVDIQVSPEGYLHVLSLYHGGDNCFSKDEIHGKDCINYSSNMPGTIFKITTNDNI